MPKKPTPAQLAARKLFAERARAGTLKRKRKTAAKNPARKTAVKRRGPSKVNAPSQATGKRPSTRLKTRRAKNTRPGVYPNPMPKKAFYVYTVDKNGNPKMFLAAFHSMALATEYATSYARAAKCSVGIFDSMQRGTKK